MYPGLLALGLMATGIRASPILSKRAELEDCLKSAAVPTDTVGSDDWKLDVAPYNERTQYKPAAIAVPQTTQHIQDAVACAVKVGVKCNAKSGGHSYAAFGLGGEDGHLVVELDRMHNVTLDTETGLAKIDGGSRLGHAASELYSQGKRAFSHGTCPGVGIGGHALHGGFGVSSNTHGLALDWVVGLTVVLANSTVVHCSETENPDLFWAMRGAGGSFGIATQFEVKTFEPPEKLTYFLAPLQWTPERAADGFKAFQDFVVKDMPAELNMRLFVQRQFTNLEGLYYGDKASLQTLLAPLLSSMRGVLAQATEGGWTDQLSHFGNGLDLNQTHPYSMNETFYSSSMYTKALSDGEIASLVDYWYSEGRTVSRDWYVQIDVHGGASSAIAQGAADGSAYAHRDYLFLYSLMDRVDEGAYPADGFPFLQNFVANVTAPMESGSWGMYINYPDSEMDGDTAQRHYWGAHVDRLQGLKGVFDPDDVFSYPQGVKPAKV